jgi:hypothetical protein
MDEIFFHIDIFCTFQWMSVNDVHIVSFFCPNSCNYWDAINCVNVTFDIVLAVFELQALNYKLP